MTYVRGYGIALFVIAKDQKQFINCYGALKRKSHSKCLDMISKIDEGEKGGLYNKV